MLRVLRVLQIQANRLWTWLEGEAEESEEEEEEEEEAADDGDEEEEEEEEEEDDDVPLTPHVKKQARGTVKREHSEDEPDDVPEKHSSSAAKAPPVLPLEPKSTCSVLCRHTALQKCHFPRIFGRVHSPWRTVQQISCMESGQAKLN